MFSDRKFIKGNTLVEALHIEIPTELDRKSVFFPALQRASFILFVERNSNSQWLRKLLGGNKFLRMVMCDIAFKTTTRPVGSLLSELKYSSFYSPDSRRRRNGHGILKQRTLRDFHGEEICSQLYALSCSPETGSQRKFIGLQADLLEGRHQSFIRVV